MADTLNVKVIGTAGKYDTVPKDQTFRMVKDDKANVFVPRDCKYPLAGPKDIAVTAAKVEPPKVVDTKPVDPKPTDPKPGVEVKS